MTDTPATPAPRRSLARQLWKALLRPGARLMGNLRLPGKLTVLVLTMAVPAYLYMVALMGDLHQRHRAVDSAREGLVLFDATLACLDHVHRLRGLSLIMLSGDAAAGESIASAQKATVKGIDEVQRAMDQLSSVSPVNTWPGLKRRLQSLAAGQHARQVGPASEQFDSALNELHRMVHDIAERSGLHDVGGARGRQLMIIALQSTLNTLGASTDLRDAGAMALAHRETASALERGQVVGMAWSLERELGDLDTELALMARQGVEIPGSWDLTTELVANLVQEIRQRFGNEVLGGSAYAFFDTASVVTEQLRAVQRDTLQRVRSLIDEQAALLREDLLRKFVLIVLFTLGIAYVIIVYQASFSGALKQVLRGMQATADGDLSRQIRVRGRDELAEIAEAFDRMSERLSGTTADIRSRASRVDLSGRQVAEGSQQLAQRTDEQSQSVHSAVASLGQISAAVAQNAQATRELDEITERLFERAEAGNLAMAETLTAMDDLQQASSRVNEMVAVIDDVAFHTGMLALNASVEAARAGVAGKGFAVVAGEVRQLSLRCAEAAEEIRSLIGDSGEKVEASSQKLQHVSVALDTLVNGVREVSCKLRSIAASSTQQSASLEEVEANIGCLQEITRDNASLVEESTAASHLLVAQGEALAATMAAMRLRHGSADEARALVERAVAHAQQHDRAKVLAEFNDPQGPWMDRDLFVFCLDRMGNILANPMSPQNVGVNVNTLDGLRGTHHSDRLWDRVNSHGSGWVRYEIAHPRTGLMTQKETFVAAMDDQTLVGCGWYGRARAADPREQMPEGPVAWSRAREDSELVHA